VKNINLIFQARDVKECEVDFNPEFTARVIPKLDWPEVVRAAQHLGQLGDTPTELPQVC
jgi:multifunctional methyltransferase subunit TRM112